MSRVPGKHNQIKGGIRLYRTFPDSLYHFMVSWAGIYVYGPTMARL